MRVALGDAFLFNPKVPLQKGDMSPYVEMAALEPHTRDVRTSSLKPYSGGVKFMNGDVLMARITPSLENGKISVYRAVSGFEDTPASGSTEFIVVRGREGVTDSSFAYYFLTSPGARSHAIKTMSGSSGRQRVQLDSFLQLKIDLPSLKKQKSISATLGAIDDKIESNRRLALLIPQIVRSYIKRSMTYVGERRIHVSDLAKFVNGGAYTKRATGAGRMVIRIAELNSGPSRSTVYNDIDVPAEKSAHAGDILMSWSGSLGVYRWFRSEAIINQHIFKVIPTEYPAWLVFDRLDAIMPFFRHIAADKATTMGHIKREHLESTEVSIPNDKDIKCLDDYIAPLWKYLLRTERQSSELSSLRDALLPELLAGRISISEERPYLERN